ncbi:hypothetical protein, partial [Streptomyces sp. UH6]|uniref:hypothetical protein n=1 Tax=Streptomyces sp. UH6 TaxID=2748379 RepID=UPI0015D4C149
MRQEAAPVGWVEVPAEPAAEMAQEGHGQEQKAAKPAGSGITMADVALAREKRKLAEAHARAATGVRREVRETVNRNEKNDSLRKSDSSNHSKNDRSHHGKSDAKNHRDAKSADTTARQIKGGKQTARTEAVKDEREHETENKKNHTVSEKRSDPDVKRNHTIAEKRSTEAVDRDDRQSREDRRDPEVKRTVSEKKNTEAVDRKDLKGTVGPVTTPDAGAGAVPAAEAAKTSEEKTPPRTQPAREAGWRDGHRAARITAPIRAYRDGAKDGWADGSTDYRTEKDRMSKARQTPEKEAGGNGDQAVAGGVPPKPSRAPDEPVVTGVTGEGSKGRVQLGGGAATESLEWGEVRTAKQLERRLRQRAKVMERRADDARAMADRARQVAGHCGQLAEAARALDIKGGVQSELARLAEAAGQQAAAAAQIEERCQRGAEAAKV